jgi:inositol-phosphate phosphatase/L-galactose 1-phosphate phosphatase/histidinol-phosphatase
MLSKEIIEFANHLADLSGEVIRKYYRVANEEVTKDDDSPVTKADRGAEKVIRDAIEKRFPDHGIIGEEFGIKEAKSEFTWILDPIDGTSSFIIGRPTFGTLIALTSGTKSLLGVMDQPITRERWLGISGAEWKGIADEGSFLNGKKINSRKCGDISAAVMCSSSSFYFQNGDEEILKRITSQTKYQKLGGVIYGGDCYSYACLAAGFVDIVIDPGLNVYDYAAMLPIIKAAGGIITDWQGNDPKLESGVKLVACGDESLHRKVLGVILSH